MKHLVVDVRSWTKGDVKYRVISSFGRSILAKSKGDLKNFVLQELDKL